MPRPKRPNQLGYEPDPWLAKEQMSELVKNLNHTMVKTTPNIRPIPHPDKGRSIPLSFSFMQEQLRLLVEQWKKSGPDMRKLFNQRHDLRDWSTKRPMTLWPTSNGRGHLGWHEPNTEDPKELAFELFFGLISNPQWEKLGGPCARCGNYFLRKTVRQKVYCSTRCGSGATALSTMQGKRRDEHKRKLRLARLEIRAWRASERTVDWKRWVCNRVPELTLNYLTRSVNRGELVGPRTNDRS